MNKIYLVHNHWNLIDKAHIIGHKSGDDFEPVILLRCKKVDATTYDDVRLELELCPTGECWLDFTNLGAGLIVVSNAFKNLLESECEYTHLRYQFFEPRLIKPCETAPKYWWLNLLSKERVTDRELRNNHLSWVFDRNLVKRFNYLFRLQHSTSMAVTSPLAEKIADSGLNGFELYNVPVE